MQKSTTGTHGKARARLIKLCADCGEEFSPIVYPGLAVLDYCASCRDRRREEQEVDHQRRLQEGLARDRMGWITDHQRGIPPKYQNLTWDDFRFDRGGEGNREKVQELREYAATFPVEGPTHGTRSLVLARDQWGVGKTMLACLVLKDIINRFEQRGRERCPFHFCPITRVKMRLRAAERYGGTESVEKVYEELTTTWLLVLDDVGKERLEGADLSLVHEMYFHILNERYNLELPVIITSNVGFSPWAEGGVTLQEIMGGAAADRLIGMAGGTAYIIEGESWR